MLLFSPIDTDTDRQTYVRFHVYLQDRTLKAVQNQRPSPFLRDFSRRFFAVIVVAIFACFLGMQEICPDDVVLRVRRAERHGARREVEDRGCFGLDFHYGILVDFFDR